MKVYIVVKGDYEWFEIVDVFVNKEQAETLCNEIDKKLQRFNSSAGADIFERELRGLP